MKTIGIREFKQRATTVLREVRETSATYEVTYRGRVIARLVPVTELESEPMNMDEYWAEWDRLGKEIGAKWPKGLSAVDAIREDRGRLGD